jgi:hypothetical protein
MSLKLIKVKGYAKLLFAFLRFSSISVQLVSWSSCSSSVEPFLLHFSAARKLNQEEEESVGKRSLFANVAFLNVSRWRGLFFCASFAKKKTNECRQNAVQAKQMNDRTNGNRISGPATGSCCSFSRCLRPMLMKGNERERSKEARPVDESTDQTTNWFCLFSIARQPIDRRSNKRDGQKRRNRDAFKR